MLNIAFLASNNGSSMQAIVKAMSSGTLQSKASLFVSNKHGTNAVVFAKAENIPSRIIPTLPDPDKADVQLSRALFAKKIDLVVLCGYLRKLGNKTLKTFEGRILNTHPALLPSYGGKGMYGRKVHEAVLAAKESFSGATIHLVDREYDHGRIIAQKQISIPLNRNIEELERLVMAVEQTLLIETIKQIEGSGMPFQGWPSD